MLLQERVTAFQDSLLTEGPVNTIRRFILGADPVVIPHADYFRLRARVSEHFQVHPNHIVLVGSCQLGFSLKLKGPPSRQERYKPVKANSDVDVCIVSDRLFHGFWDSLFETYRTDKLWSLDGGKEVVRALFAGWIAPSTIKPAVRLQEIEQFNAYFDSLNRERLLGYRRISARIYISWERLEAYQRLNTEACLRDLREQQRAS